VRRTPGRVDGLFIHKMHPITVMHFESECVMSSVLQLLSNFASVIMVDQNIILFWKKSAKLIVTIT